MKRFVARRVASVALAGTLIASGLFLTSTPANAGIIDNCKAAFRTILGYFRAVDTAAHHEQAPDERISWNDLVATVLGHADIGHLPDNQRNVNTYFEIQRQVRLLYADATNPQVDYLARRIFDQLDVAGRHDRPDGLVSPLDLQAAIANPGAICG
jgi:hypothetical protein